MSTARSPSRLRIDAPVYTLRLDAQHAHRFDLELQLQHPNAAGQEFWLPAWVPGSYLIREFSRHVLQVHASSEGRDVTVRKTAKNRWRAAPCQGPICLRWSVYARDPSVRTAFLDPSRGFFNPGCMMLAAAGREHLQHTLHIHAPRNQPEWQVATTLPPLRTDRRGFGSYRAAGYRDLIDHPVAIGHHLRVDYIAHGTPHALVIDHAPRLAGMVDQAQLRQDLQRVCEAQITLFEPETPKAPFAQYLFMLAPIPGAWGGLEHLDSSALICGEADLPHPRETEARSPGYRRLLGLCSHEYLHAWHVKRIRPQALVDGDLERENLTSLLWLFEGFTSYYDELMLLRSGLLQPQQYLDLLAEAINAVRATPGRGVQSLAEASWDAWIKFYRPDENTPNATVSYYTLGGLFALALDLTLRSRSDSSLDDVMRLLWQRYGRDDAPLHAQGVAEDALPALVREVSGLDLRRFFARHVDGCAELPLRRLLAEFGVEWSHAPAETPAALGLRLDGTGAWPTVRQVRAGSWAEQAGISPGDVLVACNGEQVTGEAIARQWRRARPGDAWDLHVMRDARLLTLRAELPAAEPGAVRLQSKARSGAGALRLRRAWLGS